MSHTTTNYLPLVVRKQLELYCSIDLDVPVALDGNPMRLQQVISNLLSSTTKSTDTGHITLRIQCSGDYLSIRARGTGVGAPTKEVVRLFDPFFQVGTGIQCNLQGMGLGLATCEKLISMMDGDISVDSKPGMGSQFMLYIPLYGAQYPLKRGAEGSADTRRWLAVRNVSLYQFLESSPTRNETTVLRYEGQQPDVDDLLVADNVLGQAWQGRAATISCRRHVGIPLEREPGEWVHSVASPHRLPTLLAHIYSIELGNEDLFVALSVPDRVGATDNDTMILVADDHPISLRLPVGQLGSLGYQCKMANDGMDVLNVLSKNYIDIALSNVSTPNMGGYRLTQRIYQLGLTLPVVGVTTSTLVKEGRRCLESGMDSCLSEPATLDVLE